MEIYYEDLMENIENNNLREKLIQLVNEHKIIVVKGFSSAQRHRIYRQMYYPLKFEKIVLNEENTDIRIFNYKIKQNEKKQTNEEKTEEIKKEDEYILEESEESSTNSKYESESSEDSYLTEEDEQLTRLEDIASQILEKLDRNGKKIDGTKKRVNFMILFNIIGWIVLYTLDPVRLIKTKIIECEEF